VYLETPGVSGKGNKYIEKFPNYKRKALYMFKETRKVGKLKHIGLFS